MPYKVNSRIKYLLYKLGIFKTDDEVGTIKFLLTLDIYPYDSNIVNTPINTINNYTLLNYIDKIKELLELDLINNKYETIHNTYTKDLTTLGLWCSDKQMTLNNVSETIKEFLLLSMKLLEIDNELRNNLNNGICLFNLKKINPYIINIRTIINDILISL